MCIHIICIYTCVCIHIYIYIYTYIYIYIHKHIIYKRPGGPPAPGTGLA